MRGERRENPKKRYECKNCGSLLTIGKEEDIKKFKCCKKQSFVLLSTEHNPTSPRIKKLLEKGKLWDEIVVGELGKKHVGDIEAREIVFLCALGRHVKNKNPYSFNVILHATSSAGKDHLVGSILELMPEEDWEAWGRISPKALNYLHTKEKEPAWTYNGKILSLEEIEDRVLNGEVMKVFTSGTNKAAIVKDSEIKMLEIEGKPVVFTTTATTIPTEEIMNRFNIVKIDESEEQTARIFEHEEEEYGEEIKDFLGSLECLDVEIPTRLRKAISKVFPRKRTRARRDFERFLDWIRAIAIFHQSVRKGKTTKTIRAEVEDYEIAKESYMHCYLSVADFVMNVVDKKIVGVLESSEEPQSAREIEEAMKGYLSVRNLYHHLEDLRNKGVLLELDSRDDWSHPIKRYSLSEEFKDKQPIKLPPSSDLFS